MAVIEGMDRLLANLQRLQSQLPQELAQAVHAVMEPVFQASQEQVPVGHTTEAAGSLPSGAVRTSGKHPPAEVSGNVITDTISYGGAQTQTRDGYDLAVLLHEGTRPHIIPGNPWLYFEDSQGQLIRVHEVHHPGTTGRKYLEQPVMEAQAGMETELGTHTEQVIQNLVQ